MLDWALSRKSLLIPLHEELLNADRNSLGSLGPRDDPKPMPKYKRAFHRKYLRYNCLLDLFFPAFGRRLCAGTHV